MNKILTFINKFLYPPKLVSILLSSVVFTALIFIFVNGQNDSVIAYTLYGLSAYCMTILVLASLKFFRKAKIFVFNKVTDIPFGRKYFDDITFRGGISIYQGMIVNFLYVVFRMVVGISYASVWFISMAAYYLVLGIIRMSLIISYRHRDMKSEWRCYRRTGWMLFLLNIPMGGMIIQMVLNDSGYSYPGYIIYLSAMYTFYTMILSLVNLIKFRKSGSPILSAAKILNFVAAMMSILGLQSAMILQFSSHGEAYSRMMNSITGGFVYGTVIFIAVYMLLHSRKIKKE